MDIYETNIFGDLLKQFRKRSKLDQLALAYKIGKRSRGSVQAWENGSLPRDREMVIALARALQLTESETDKLLLAAHYLQEFRTQGASSSADEKRAHLCLVDTSVNEQSYTPIINMTLHNNGTRTAIPTEVQIEILDVGEFHYYNEDEDEDDLTRSFLPPSGTYGVKLSPALKGECVSVKIFHQLQSDEADRFQLAIDPNVVNPSLAYIWYCLKIAIFYNEPRHKTEAKAIIISVPPVDADITDVWPSLLAPRAERNRATLRRMSKLSANRSDSVEATIRRVLGE